MDLQLKRNTLLEQKGDLWELAKIPNILCLSTNGFVKKSGECVMGRGIAKEAKDRFPAIAKDLGRAIQLGGNNVEDLGPYGNYYIFSFPVKHNWWEKADPKLIVKSMHQLLNLVDTCFSGRRQRIYLPRVGCGNGQLKWEDVKPLLSDVLDDRFIAVSK